MATKNFSKKCNCCGGNRWEYNKAQKVWICLYCENQAEYKEEYDGLYTIKNVARQVVLDTAYRKLDQADRNISECQKISASYVGTLIAGICFRLIAAVSGGYGSQDSKALVGQLKRDYQTLDSIADGIGDDERTLYEFMDSSDAWAVLATVFDTLGDEDRREYLLTLVNPAEVFSKETNKSLLRFALKEGRMDLADQIFANTENIDIKDAFSVLLQNGADGENKARFGAKMIAAGAVTKDDKDVFEDYLVGSDSVATKAAMTTGVLRAGIELNLGIVVREVFAGVDLPTLKELLNALFSRRLYDGEIELLLNFAALQKEEGKCLAILDSMVASSQFLSLNLAQCENFLFNTNFSSEGKLQIVNRLKQFTPADRLWESLAGDYIAKANDKVDVRNAMVPALLQGINSIPAKDFEAYVLNCNADEQNKPERIRQILELPNMNVGFFRELAGQYLKRNTDAPDVKTEVFRNLLECGFAVESGILMDYVCNSKDSDESKVELLQLANRNHGNLRADALSVYLENCIDRFSPLIFGALYRDSSTVSPKALQNYVLGYRDCEGAKVRNAVSLSKHTGMALGASACDIRYGSGVLKCNLAQAYILVTSDPLTVAQSMVEEMERAGAKLGADIYVGGSSVKFRKYLNENKDRLSETALKICEEKRLFSFSLFSF